MLRASVTSIVLLGLLGCPKTAARPDKVPPPFILPARPPADHLVIVCEGAPVDEDDVALAFAYLEQRGVQVPEHVVGGVPCDPTENYGGIIYIDRHYVDDPGWSDYTLGMTYLFFADGPRQPATVARIHLRGDSKDVLVHELLHIWLPHAWDYLDDPPEIPHPMQQVVELYSWDFGWESVRDALHRGGHRPAKR